MTATASTASSKFGTAIRPLAKVGAETWITDFGDKREPHPTFPGVSLVFTSSITGNQVVSAKSRESGRSTYLVISSDLQWYMSCDPDPTWREIRNFMHPMDLCRIIQSRPLAGAIGLAQVYSCPKEGTLEQWHQANVPPAPSPAKLEPVGQVEATYGDLVVVKKPKKVLIGNGFYRVETADRTKFVTRDGLRFDLGEGHEMGWLDFETAQKRAQIFALYPKQAPTPAKPELVGHLARAAYNAVVASQSQPEVAAYNAVVAAKPDEFGREVISARGGYRIVKHHRQGVLYSVETKDGKEFATAAGYIRKYTCDDSKKLGNFTLEAATSRFDKLCLEEYRKNLATTLDTIEAKPAPAPAADDTWARIGDLIEQRGDFVLLKKPEASADGYCYTVESADGKHWYTSKGLKYSYKSSWEGIRTQGWQNFSEAKAALDRVAGPKPAPVPAPAPVTTAQEGREAIAEANDEATKPQLGTLASWPHFYPGRLTPKNRETWVSKYVMGFPESSGKLVRTAENIQHLLKTVGIKLSSHLFSSRALNQDGLSWIFVPTGSAGGLVDRIHFVWRQELGQGRPATHGWIEILADEVVLNWGRIPEHDRLV